MVANVKNKRSMRTEIIEILQKKYPEYCMQHIDTADEILRLLDVVGQSEQLVCDHQWKSRFSEKRGYWRLCTKCRKEG